MSTTADRRGRAGRALAGLAGLATAAWLYLLTGAALPMPMRGMDAMAGMAMAQTPAWTPGYAALVFGMWTAMMAAMMLPGAAPAVVRIAHAKGAARAAWFVTAYLAVWTAFGAAATAGQWALDASHLLSDAMALRSAALAGALVCGIGVYQFTSWKSACLGRCRSLEQGLAGAPAGPAREIVRLGLRYGTECLGCCAALMVLLIVAGVMNLAWAAAIAVWVAAEQLLPSGPRLARAGGTALIVWGSAILLAAARG